MKKFLNILLGRAFFLIMAFFIQLIVIIFIIYQFQLYFAYFTIFSIVLTIFLVLLVINGNMNSAYKIAWIIALMSFPAFGWIFYLFFKNGRFNKITKAKEREFYYEILKQLPQIIKQEKKLLHNISKTDLSAFNQASYLTKYCFVPIFKNYNAKYFSIGEEYYFSLIEELKKAKKFIFMEYFIIQEGKMWNNILEILRQKVKEGVEVRVIFDDAGCIMTLPRNYKSKLESFGIKASVFNPINFVFTPIYNNRTHRKITVIDGKVAFTGGINLADEYINEIKKYGHWKDTGILIKGEAVWSFTLMFLTVWYFIRKTNEDFLTFKTNDFEQEFVDDGYVIPFSDSPLDDEIVSENVYLNLIYSANKYVYINTPYLIIDSEMTTAICLAAKRGVDVRIVTPHIPDKKAVFEVTRDNYLILIKNGVKIYEYSPGFIHAKSFVVDDKYAVIGTINLDYRSLYLHFECGVWLYNCNVIFDIKNDFIKTLELCEEYSLEKCLKVSKARKLFRSILKVFAPLM